MEIVTKKQQRGVRYYDVRKVGEKRLQEMNLWKYTGSIDVCELGKRSIKREPTLIAFVDEKWMIIPNTRENRRWSRGHGYMMVGRKWWRVSYHDHMESGKGLADCDDQEIFRSAMGGRRSGKKTRISGSHKPSPDMRDGVGSVGKVITTKRFDNSRLTCVMKTNKWW